MALLCHLFISSHLNHELAMIQKLLLLINYFLMRMYSYLVIF
jgi:hypothetical protein